VAKIDPLADETLKALFDQSLIDDQRSRALSPEHPVLRGTAQNPDTFFQCREAQNPWFDAFPRIVQKARERFCRLTAHTHRLFRPANLPTPRGDGGGGGAPGLGPGRVSGRR